MKIECSVCFEKLFDNVRPILVTKCGHLFHEDCMDNWMKQTPNQTCPQCRHPVNNDLRKVFYNTTRNSDVFNSTVFINLRSLQEDLCITQDNLTRQIEQLKTENQALNAKNLSIINEYESKIKTKDDFWKNTCIQLESRIKNLVQENTRLKDELKIAQDRIRNAVHEVVVKQEKLDPPLVST